ncbi:PQQ-dependent sugar dehydrogenase [Streptomyces sp. AA0539]|uniref:PQQ-dependent sugar dehydrogenase n=1 Tax=Streptomyces sp. AA0539 TaxID=1210045 RepID=UPI0002D7038B|nr:PQQ-dependent sugar dehydrogenase [Streptomyces sp. AA0539]
MRRKKTLTAWVAAMAAAVISLPAVAVAHDGHPHPDPTPPNPTSEFQKVTLNDSPGEPIDLAVLPDGRVLHTTRDGQVWLNNPRNGLNTLAAQLDVYTHDEEGLQSVAIDPGFNGLTNRWVYLFYAPPLDTPIDDPATPDINEGDAPITGSPEDFAPFEGVSRLSRFQLRGNTLDLSTEQQIIEVEADRGICCHVGGDIVFDRAGNLLLSTGDDSNPFDSAGYTPIDERTDRNPAYDAQRTSANTNDLRGKVLRIKVNRDGSYSIPRGNLFPPGTENARPEIYLMGLRNPFRMEIDPRDDTLYVADYSPDARTDNPQRGPAGTGKWFAARNAGNHGWPYCVSPDMPYVEYDFATGVSGEPFDCAAPVNDSWRNTGLRELPPVEPAQLLYGYEESAEFPELGAGGIGPMAGPVYEYNWLIDKLPGSRAWPKEYAGKPLFFEFTRDRIWGLSLDRQAQISQVQDVLPGMEFSALMDMEFGPDGALYVLEYGKGYFAQNPEAQLARIDYIGKNGNHSPVPVVSADVTSGHAPLTVNFSSEGTVDPDGDRLLYAWDFNSDGKIDSRKKNPTFTYKEDGVYTASLRVTDIGGRDRGRSANAEVQIVIGNDAPEVRFIKPESGGEFSFGDLIEFEVEVTDDQPVDCARVTVTYILGHDDHGHPMTTARGCSGTIRTGTDDSHDPEHDNLMGVFVASYTDPGVNGLPPLTGTAEVTLNPIHH